MARPRPGTFDPPGTGRWPPLFPSNLEQRQLRTQHQRVKVSGHHEPPLERWASRMIEGVMSDVNQLEMKARIGEILNRWPAVGLAVGVSATDASGSSTDTSFADVPPNYTSAASGLSRQRRRREFPGRWPVGRLVRLAHRLRGPTGRLPSRRTIRARSSAGRRHHGPPIRTPRPSWPLYAADTRPFWRRVPCGRAVTSRTPRSSRRRPRSDGKLCAADMATPPRRCCAPLPATATAEPMGRLPRRMAADR
jgi:hypothetical protein